MNYLVLECHPGYAILLDPEGRFVRAANLRYQVGQRVRDPVLMREQAPRTRHTVRWIGAALATAAACLLLFFGFHSYQNYWQVFSSIHLTINPAVQMDLNRQGTVVRVTGTNPDGEQLVEGYSGRGKDKVTVADELIDRAIEMGVLSEGGRVSFAIDSPDETLFEQYGIELRTEVENHLAGRMSVIIEIVPYQTKSSDQPQETEPPVSTAPPTIPQQPQPQSPENDSDYDDGSGSNGASDYGNTADGPSQSTPAVTTPPVSNAPAPADTDYGTGNGGVTDDSGDSDYSDPDDDLGDDKDDNDSNYEDNGDSNYQTNHTGDDDDDD